MIRRVAPEKYDEIEKVSPCFYNETSDGEFVFKRIGDIIFATGLSG